MPDFDIDFCMDRRDEVIDYVAERYGRDRVSQIITYGSMAARAVVRDVGRVLGYPYGFVDQIAKLIPFDLNMTLERALSEEPTLRERYDAEEEVHTLIDLAKKLEGLVRNAGKHAGGVVIAPAPLTIFHAAVLRTGFDGPSYPVRHGRCRGDGAGEIRLSGPQNAHDHRSSGARHQCLASASK